MWVGFRGSRCVWVGFRGSRCGWGLEGMGVYDRVYERVGVCRCMIGYMSV